MVKDGGLKLLQITDNGHGINREDLPILCERFTTSKLKAFEDLTSIGTYGFRGEALASISHIAHLTVTTRTNESSCAWRAHYSGGKLTPPKPGQSADPKATAGRQGTQITVEDLFYNVPTRKRAFRSGSEEYAKILDLVGRYAVHCTGVAFSCKKHGDSATGISVPTQATTVDRIRQIHGTTIANELIEFDVQDDDYGFKANGWVSNANYHVKRTAFLLFINHRAVESSVIKKAIERIYSQFLPKGGHPFIYLSLDIDPVRVDVNVHPTKREVHFLNEDEIVQEICDEISEKLAQVDTSRIFMTQSILPGARVPAATISQSGNASTLDQRLPSKTYENNLIRTDSKMRKITSMLPPSNPDPSDPFVDKDDTAAVETEYITIDREPVHCRLITVRELRAEVRDSVHAGLTETIASHTFVGIVDVTRRIAAIQGGVKLFLVDYGMLANEYFYQVGLTDFLNFGRIKFDQPLELKRLLELGTEAEREVAGQSAAGVNWDDVVTKVYNQLLERREMLSEYFSLDITEDGMLHSIPLLVKGYTPSMAKLPRFLLNLGPKVDWKDEKDCFHTFLRELAAFYVPEQLPPPPPSEKQKAGVTEDTEMAVEPSEEVREIEKRRRELERAIENILFPAFKARLLATKGLLRGVIEVANLKGLYRVFERC